MTIEPEEKCTTDDLLADSKNISNLLQQNDTPKMFFSLDRYKQVADYVERFRETNEMTRFAIYLRYGLTYFMLEEFLLKCRAAMKGGND